MTKEYFGPNSLVWLWNKIKGLKLSNPNKLILSGAVSAEYDGSSEVKVNIPAGGGGTGGPVEWNDVQNKPFYEETKTVLDQNAEFTFDNDMLMYTYMPTGAVDLSALVVDADCTVTWGDEVYRCKVGDFNGMCYVGNIGILFGDPNLGEEPFGIMASPQDGLLAIMDAYAQEEKTLYVKIECGVLKKIDNKFVDIEAIADSVKKPQVTVYLDTSKRTYLCSSVDFSTAMSKSELNAICSDKEKDILIRDISGNIYSPLVITGRNSEPYMTVYYFDGTEMKACYTAEYTG